MESDLVHRIAFSKVRGINMALAGQLLQRLDSEEAFFSMNARSIASVMGFSNRIFDDAYRKDLLERAAGEMSFISAHNIRPIYFTDPGYPSRLAQADDAPLMLYTLGNADMNTGHFMAIVGTRHATPYGIDFVKRLIGELKDILTAPVTIVSGLALGIDAAAHSAAIRAGIPTIGVLGHGFNTLYPSQNRAMAAEIARGKGALITEYLSSDPIHKGNFIARNRIIAALCDCTVVAESATKGGALITARLASGYDRDVFAVPGRTSDRYSAGCNDLIARNVAALVRNGTDIANAMNWPTKETATQQQSLFHDLSLEEQAVVDYLTQHGEARLNQLTIAANLPTGRMMSTLIDMEFKGLLLSYPGGKYRLA